jgi:hypothetical protein
MENRSLGIGLPDGLRAGPGDVSAMKRGRTLGEESRVRKEEFCARDAP